MSEELLRLNGFSGEYIKVKNFDKYIVKEDLWSSDYKEGEVVAYSIPRNIYDSPPNTFKVIMFYGDNNLVLARTKKYFDRMRKQMKGNK